MNANTTLPPARNSQRVASLSYTTTPEERALTYRSLSRPLSSVIRSISSSASVKLVPIVGDDENLTLSINLPLIGGIKNFTKKVFLMDDESEFMTNPRIVLSLMDTLLDLLADLDETNQDVERLLDSEGSCCLP